MTISKAKIVRLLKVDDIIETEEGLLLKHAMLMLRVFRILTFPNVENRKADEEYQIILEQLIRKQNNEQTKKGK